VKWLAWDRSMARGVEVTLVLAIALGCSGCSFRGNLRAMIPLNRSLTESELSYCRELPPLRVGIIGQDHPAAKAAIIFPVLYAYKGIDARPDGITGYRMRLLGWPIPLVGNVRCAQFDSQGKLKETFKLRSIILLHESLSDRTADGTAKAGYFGFLFFGGGHCPSGWVGRCLFKFGPGAKELDGLTSSWMPPVPGDHYQ